MLGEGILMGVGMMVVTTIIHAIFDDRWVPRV